MRKKTLAVKIEAEIEKELAEVKKILKSKEADDIKFRSVLAIFRGLSKELVDAKINSMFESRTGLLSAKFGEEALRQQLELSKRTKDVFSVALIDIDFLKYINDRYGHVTGTKVIVAVARILKEEVRGADILCRYGGDEFLAIFPGIEARTARTIVNRIKKRLKKETFLDGAKATVSIGLIDSSGGFEGTEKMLEAADKRLYRAKKRRTNVNLK